MPIAQPVTTITLDPAKCDGRRLQFYFPDANPANLEIGDQTTGFTPGMHVILQNNGPSDISMINAPGTTALLRTAFNTLKVGGVVHLYFRTSSVETQAQVWDFEYSPSSLNLLDNVTTIGADDGDVLTYNAGIWGPTAPATGGGGESATLIFSLEMLSGSAQFSGALYSNWQNISRLDLVSDSSVTIDSYTGHFTLAPGLWEVTVNGYYDSSTGTFPTGLTSYGVELEPTGGSLLTPGTTLHTRFTENGIPNGPQALSNAPSNAAQASFRVTLNDRFLVGYSNSGTLATHMFSYAYNNTSVEITGRLIMSFKRLGSYELV